MIQCLQRDELAVTTVAHPNATGAEVCEVRSREQEGRADVGIWAAQRSLLRSAPRPICSPDTPRSEGLLETFQVHFCQFTFLLFPSNLHFMTLCKMVSILSGNFFFFLPEE